MNECVLVVDDDREIVKAIAILLEKEGYQVCRAYDGLQALDILMSREVHLILMDIMMPKLDGLSALMKIREQKNLPVIVLSAKGEETDKILGLSMGADDYIAKPYLPQELVARVRSHLRRYMSLGSIHEQAREGRLERRMAEYESCFGKNRIDFRDRCFVCACRRCCIYGIFSVLRADFILRLDSAAAVGRDFIQHRMLRLS